MFNGGWSGGGGWGGFGPGGFGPRFGPDPGGPGFGPGPGKRIKFAAVATSALLLEGPADTAGIVERFTDASGGQITPPQDGVELGIGLLAGRGIVTVDEGTATLTEFGHSVLAWRGVSSETARAMIGWMSKFADVMKWHRDLHEAAGLARTIAHSGTDEQKATADAAKAKLLATIDEVKKSLHGALA